MIPVLVVAVKNIKNAMEPKKIILTLVLITRDNQILLGLKKRGFGMGKFNGFGGKLETGETIEENATREVFEESSLEVKTLKPVAIMNITWQTENLEIHVFHCNNFVGQATESEEMLPSWFDIDDIPYKKMWADTKYWFPIFLKGQQFTANFIFFTYCSYLLFF